MEKSITEIESRPSIWDVTLEVYSDKIKKNEHRLILMTESLMEFLITHGRRGQVTWCAHGLREEREREREREGANERRRQQGAARRPPRVREDMVSRSKITLETKTVARVESARYVNLLKMFLFPTLTKESRNEWI